MKEEHKFLQTTRFSFEISNFLRWIFCKKRGIRRNEGEEMKERMINFFFWRKIQFCCNRGRMCQLHLERFFFLIKKYFRKYSLKFLLNKDSLKKKKTNNRYPSQGNVNVSSRLVEWAHGMLKWVYGGAARCWSRSLTWRGE